MKNVYIIAFVKTPLNGLFKDFNVDVQWKIKEQTAAVRSKMFRAGGVEALLIYIVDVDDKLVLRKT